MVIQISGEVISTFSLIMFVSTTLNSQEEMDIIKIIKFGRLAIRVNYIKGNFVHRLNNTTINPSLFPGWVGVPLPHNKPCVYPLLYKQRV